jgi:hypothetical protein
MPRRRPVDRVCAVCGQPMGEIDDNLWSPVYEKHISSGEHQAALEKRKTIKFFIPFAKDDKQASEEYERIKKLVGRDVSPRRIFSIGYQHDGKQYYAEVGKTETRQREVVIAILESGTYLIFTPSRGVVGGFPILVGSEEARDVADFVA